MARHNSKVKIVWCPIDSSWHWELSSENGVVVAASVRGWKEKSNARRAARSALQVAGLLSLGL